MELSLNIRTLFERCTDEQLALAEDYLNEKGGSLADLLLPMIASVIANKVPEERRPSLSEICDTVKQAVLEHVG